MQIGVAIEATMQVRRPPAGPLSTVGGRPLLSLLLERLQLSRRLSGSVICTTTAASDDRIAEFASFFDVPIVRGAHSLALTVAEAALNRGDDAMLCASPYAPLLDPGLVDHAIEMFQLTGVDLVTNRVGGGYPPGQEIEIVQRAAFARALREQPSAVDCAQVCQWMCDSHSVYRTRAFAAVRDYGDLNLAVTSTDDLNRLTELVRALPKPTAGVTLQEIATIAPRMDGAFAAVPSRAIATTSR